MSKTASELKQLLSLGEKQTLEYIESCDLQHCGPHVCAFLNTQGGYLVCGVNDQGNINGIENVEQVAERLESQLQSTIQPPVLFSVEVQEVENKQLVIVEVPAGKDIPYAFNSDIYVRSGDEMQKADVDTIRDMVMRKQVEPTRWERLFSSELDEQGLSASACKKLLSAKRIPKEVAQAEQGLLHQLQLLSLAKYGRLTNAADVLLANAPGKRHPQARVRAVCYRHKADDEYQDLQHLDGPMAEVIEQLITFIMRNTPSRARFSSTNNQREDIPMYPEQAVREAIVNAFAHRDYSNFAGGIKVEVSPTHLKIWNAGAFPQGIDEHKIQQGHISVLRNPDIAHGLYLQGYMEKLGRGSVVIQDACKAAGLPAPKWYSDNTSGVTLTLFATEVTTEVTMEVTTEVTTEVARMISVMNQEHSRDELMGLMSLKNAEHFRKHYLKAALEITPALVEMTVPDKPTSRNQKYRLTSLGLQVKQQLSDERKS
ncbi:RNA-binding domain-containing protein [Aeromonas veronii]|uniref:RNA-binding domain-containing protein n=1 Tax=Aeromonas veronii TaxID=654 RepID=UPI003D22D04A